MILDQAGWHGAKKLKIPANISLLPPKEYLAVHAPELALKSDLQILRPLRLEHSN
jgi:hypothetical protein